MQMSVDFQSAIYFCYALCWKSWAKRKKKHKPNQTCDGVDEGPAWGKITVESMMARQKKGSDEKGDWLLSKVREKSRDK